MFQEVFSLFVLAAAADFGQTKLSDGRMSGSSWSTGAEVTENRGRRRNLLEGKIIVEGVKEVFWGNREAGAGENLPAVARNAGENTINSKCHVRRNDTFIQT